MESELNDLNSKPHKSYTTEPESQPQSQTIHDDASSRDDDASSKDDRPLLKSDSATSICSESLEDLEKKYAPYVRRDVYGTMGRGELPTKEKLLLGFALVTLLPIRVVLAMTILILYYLICRICTLFSVPNRDEEQEDYAHMGGWKRVVIVQSGRALSRLMLFVLGFYWISESYRIPNTDRKSNTEVTLFDCVCPLV